MPIHVLDENTINKIAAGEVVDRPSSIVKEMVENAIDAHSTAITVEIKDGGISMIRITDNGDGIPEDEVRVAFAAHATSKIKDAADLASITSLGFRGEALSSICAVSQVELITKVRQALTGTRYEIEGSCERTFEQVGAPDGTTFIVRNLFYNTPARRKFLKSATTEGGYIGALMEHMAMSHPEISFRFLQNGQPKLQTVGNGNLKDVIYAVYGREIANNLIEIKAEDESIKIYGYIGKPTVSRGNRTFENYYINHRYVKSNIIMKAIEDAFNGFVMQHKYPFTCFCIDIAPELIDVNVHPAKMELRFADGQGIYTMVRDAIHDALTRKELIPEVSIGKIKSAPHVESPISKEVKSAPTIEIAKLNHTKVIIDTIVPERPTAPEEPKKQEIFIAPKKAEALEDSVIMEPPVKLPVRMPEPFEEKRNIDYTEVLKAESEKVKAEQLSLFEKEDLLEEKNIKDIHIVGQIFDTYWIMEFEKNVYIVDQHAAHEKVLYEKFMKSYLNRMITTQQISPPVIISLTMQEMLALKNNLQYFESYGFEIEEFGGDEIALRGIPSDFTEAKPAELLLEIIDSITEDTHLRVTPESIKDRIATMSCKAAVKGNNKLSVGEMNTLLQELMNLDNPYNCPHGRPTMITMSENELEKKFKRIV